MTEIKDTNNVLIKLSDAIANPLIKVYQAGKLGLVFIFIGLVMVTTAEIKGKDAFSIPTFWIGIVLLLFSFIIFLLQQINNPILKKDNIDIGKDAIDNIQELSINLLVLTGRVQSFSLKYVNDIYAFVSSGLPYLEKIPFIPDNIKKAGINAKNINDSIIDFSTRSEALIKEIKDALIKSDIKKLKQYLKDVKNMNDQINILLKK